MSDDKLAKKFSEDEGSSGDDADLDALESETEQEEIKGRNKVYEKKVSFEDYQSALKYMQEDDECKKYRFRGEKENRIVGDKRFYSCKKITRALKRLSSSAIQNLMHARFGSPPKTTHTPAKLRTYKLSQPS